MRSQTIKKTKIVHITNVHDADKFVFKKMCSRGKIEEGICLKIFLINPQ